MTVAHAYACSTPAMAITWYGLYVSSIGVHPRKVFHRCNSEKQFQLEKLQPTHEWVHRLPVHPSLHKRVIPGTLEPTMQGYVQASYGPFYETPLSSSNRDADKQA